MASVKEIVQLRKLPYSFRREADLFDFVTFFVRYKMN